MTPLSRTRSRIKRGWRGRRPPTPLQQPPPPRAKSRINRDGATPTFFSGAGRPPRRAEDCESPLAPAGLQRNDRTDPLQGTHGQPSPGPHVPRGPRNRSQPSNSIPPRQDGLEPSARRTRPNSMPGQPPPVHLARWRPACWFPRPISTMWSRLDASAFRAWVDSRASRSCSAASLAAAPLAP